MTSAVSASVADMQLDSGHTVSVESLDGREDVSKVRVTEVRMNLSVVADSRCGKSERVDCPSEVVVPIGLSERETFSDGRFVHLDSLDSGVGEVDNFVSESEGELLGLNLLGDVGTGERPVENLRDIVGLVFSKHRGKDGGSR